MACCVLDPQHCVQIHGQHRCISFFYRGIVEIVSSTPIQISSLDDVKSATQNDNNASKAMALDHLGVIAGRLRANMMKFGRTRLDVRPLRAEASLRTVDEVSTANIRPVVCSESFFRSLQWRTNCSSSDSLMYTKKSHLICANVRRKIRLTRYEAIVYVLTLAP